MENAEKSFIIGMHHWRELGNTIAELRIQVWGPLCEPGMPGLKLTRLEEPLDEDPRTIHFAAHSQSTLVAAARLTVDYLPSSIHTRVPDAVERGNAMLSRLVVNPNFQGRGIAKSLELACIAHSRELGQRFLWAEASPSTSAPLQRMGFTLVARYSEGQAIFVRQEISILRLQL